MAFTKLAQILPKRIAHYGLEQEATSAQVCFEAKKAAPGRFEPISFKNDVLTIKVKNSLAAQELQAEKDKIIDKINQRLKHLSTKLEVKKIRFRV